MVGGQQPEQKQTNWTDAHRYREQAAVRVKRAFTFICTLPVLSFPFVPDVEESEQMFAQVESQDPYRLSHVDTYSNVLYLQENVAELSRLAHHVATIDKFRPETCCVIGASCLGQQAH